VGEPDSSHQFDRDSLKQMPINPRYSRLVAALLSPVLVRQGKRVRLAIPGLPDAALPWSGSLEGDDPLRILVLGDSTAAGVGADTQEDALPGNLARVFAAELERGVTWRAIGENGATARDLVTRFLDDASTEPYDVIFLSVGANDTLMLRSPAAFRRDIRTILRRLRKVSPNALILVSCLPAFWQYLTLPNPLRFTLNLHAQHLEATARQFVKSEPGVIMSPPAPQYTDGFFAIDQFHPSANGYRQWVDYFLTDAKLIRES
jgi:lysophospholipase L1-like esterase